jgi:hypothetical protein
VWVGGGGGGGGGGGPSSEEHMGVHGLFAGRLAGQGTMQFRGGCPRKGGGGLAGKRVHSRPKWHKTPTHGKFQRVGVVWQHTPSLQGHMYTARPVHVHPLPKESLQWLTHGLACGSALCDGVNDGGYAITACPPLVSLPPSWLCHLCCC